MHLQSRQGLHGPPPTLLRGGKIKFVSIPSPWPGGWSPMGGPRRVIGTTTHSRAPGHAPVHSFGATLAPMLLDAPCGVHRGAWTAADLTRAGTRTTTVCSITHYTATVCRSRRSQPCITDSCGPCSAGGPGEGREGLNDPGCIFLV